MTGVLAIALAWMAFAVAAVWLLPTRFRRYALLGSTVLFLVFNAPLSLALLTLIAVTSYIPFCYAPGKKCPVFLVTGAAVLLFILFKAGYRIDSGDGASALIPLGLSYYVLRVVHYSVDRYKGKILPHSFTDYAEYLFFLPVIAAGPINRFQEFQRNLRRRRWDSALFSQGLERILYGLAKIVILGNYVISIKFAQAIRTITPAHPSLGAYLDCIRYGLNLYFQFSGYSDAAIGFALLLGFRISENFNVPLLAVNIRDFWNRWHISLSEWCRDYVFIPVVALGRRHVAGIVASMLVLGLWHEFSSRYVVWGLYHGAGIVLWHSFQKAKPRYPEFSKMVDTRTSKVFSWVLTMNFVFLSFAITKEPNLLSALAVYRKILFFWS